MHIRFCLYTHRLPEVAHICSLSKRTPFIHVLLEHTFYIFRVDVKMEAVYSSEMLIST
jgi:hypothetical protein